MKKLHIIISLLNIISIHNASAINSQKLALQKGRLYKKLTSTITQYNTQNQQSGIKTLNAILLFLGRINYLNNTYVRYNRDEEVSKEIQTIENLRKKLTCINSKKLSSNQAKAIINKFTQISLR